MNCELCGKDYGILVLLPLHQSNGSLCTFACLECTKKSSVYCPAHNEVHRGFQDGSTACASCIEAMVRIRTPNAFQIWASILNVLSPAEKDWLRQAYEIGSILSGDGEEISVLRFIACAAVRTGRTPEEVLHEIQKNRSVHCILS